MNIFMNTISQSVSKIQKLSNSQIVCDGNSLTSGYGSSSGNDYPAQLSQIYPLTKTDLVATNVGVSGQTTLDMLSDAVTQVDALYDEDLDFNFLLVWEARNHLVVDAPTNTEAYNKLVEYCEDRKAVGWTVIIATITPSWAVSYRGDSTVTGYNLLDSDRLVVNQMIRDNYLDFADGLCDLALISGMSDLGDNEESGYTFSSTRPTISENGIFSDGTHFTDYGYSIIASAFVNVIYSLLQENESEPTENYLLDTYEGAATAYSLQYLSSSFVGSDVILVRRDSDDAEQGFTPSEITDGTLVAFTGAGNGYVKTWYDQSGNNRDASQTSNSLQPKIVDSGSLIVVNGKPAIRFNSSYLETTTFTLESQPITKILVVKQNADNFGYMIDGSSTHRGVVGSSGTTYIPRLFAGTVLTLTSAGANAFTDQSLIFALFDSSDSKMSINSTDVGTGNSGANGLEKVVLGVNGSTLNTQSFLGELQEVLVYPNDQTTNQASLEADIIDYYEIS